MPSVERSAEAAWEGNVARGSGQIEARSGAFGPLPFSLASRISAPEGKTSPEELLAAAHAGCYAMSLAGELANAGQTSVRVRVTATVTLDEIEGGSHRIVASQDRRFAASRARACTRYRRRRARAHRPRCRRGLSVLGAGQGKRVG
jgi:OsmC subfamily peroxiredoxin